MFERFTEKAIKVIMLAQEEARRLGHNFVGTEQVLLGLIGEGTGVAAKTLKSMGVNLKDARKEVERKRKEVERIMTDNNFIRVGSSPDMYEEDTGLYHKTIEYEKERIR